MKYQFIGTDVFDQAGTSVASAGDVDGDGKDDLIIGAIDDGRGGSAYLMTAVDLAAADAADGVTDGKVNLENIGGHTSSYRLRGVSLVDKLGSSVASAGDVDNDGRDDLIIGANRAYRNDGAAYLVTAASLSLLDAADGTTDGTIFITHASDVNGAYVLRVIPGDDYLGGQSLLRVM